MAKNPLNILFLASWYPSANHATLGNFVQRHAEAAATLHRVCVVAAFPSSSPRIEKTETDNLLEIKVYFKKKTPLFSYEKAMQQGIKEAGGHFGKFDITHIHVAYPAGIAALKLKMPYVVTEHFSGYHPQSGYRWGVIKKHLTLRILNKAEMLLPVSNHLGEALRQFGAHTPSTPVANVVDNDLFFPSKNPPGRFNFLHISTLEERSKNITGLLKGFKMLEERGHQFNLTIGGDGDLEVLRSKIETYGPAMERITVFGEKKIEDIAVLMRQSHCLVMFSHFENQPCTILEALCSGLPVVSSAVGGIAEVINEENGLLVEPDNPQDFADALEGMIKNIGKYDPLRISEQASEQFSYEAVGQKLSAIYLSVLK